MSAHTPGPWQVVDGAIGERVPVVTDANDTMVARIPPDRANAEADAHLIAAAPELLGLAVEALGRHVEFECPTCDEGCPLGSAWRATIRAARGER